MKPDAREIISRSVQGLVAGVAVCLLYWLSGLVPREMWFGSTVGAELIQAKGWLWPAAILDAALGQFDPWFVAVVLYAMNGLTYAAVALGFLVVRASVAAYCSLAFAVLLALGWFNVSVLHAFSWLGFVLILAGLIFMGARDLRSDKSGPQIQKV